MNYPKIYFRPRTDNYKVEMDLTHSYYYLLTTWTVFFVWKKKLLFPLKLEFQRWSFGWIGRFDLGAYR